MLIKCACLQVWDVFEVEDPEPEEAEFSLYATVELDNRKFPGASHYVEEGMRFYEGDLCPTCQFPLEKVVRDYAAR